MNSLWRCLEEVRGLSAVTAEWRRHTGADFEAFQTGFLQKTGRLARSFPCPRKSGCTHQVVPSGSGFVGVCKEDDGTGCGDLRLTVEDVEVWEMNRSRLGRAVARVFGCEPIEADLGVPGAAQVGTFGGVALTVVLTIQESREDFRGAVAELVAKHGKGLIVLAPTSRFSDGNTKALLKGVNAGFFDLESHLTFLPSGKLQARRSGGELFSPLLPTASQPTDENQARQVFALIERLESGSRLKNPSVMEVFRLYCIKGKTTDQIKDICNTSKGTVINRLESIRKATDTEPDALRAFSPYLQRIEENITDSRAEYIDRKAQVTGTGEIEDETD